MNDAVLVLNQNYEPLNVCSIRRAITLVIGDKAEILERYPDVLHSARRAFALPSVIRLLSFIRRPRPRIKMSRREVFIRDRYTCQYCGRHGHELTIDHVIPRSRGGLHEWTNVVACCRTCNHRKGNKSLIQVGMTLRTLPFEPRPSNYYTIERRLDLSRFADWQKFLPGLEPPITWSSSSPEASLRPA